MRLSRPAWGIDIEWACSGDSSHREPGEKLHLLVGSVTWAHLTACPTRRNNRVKGRGGEECKVGDPYTDSIIFLHIRHHGCSRHKLPLPSLCSFPIFRVQQTHQTLSPQQGAGIALPRAQQMSLPLSDICKAHTRTRGRSVTFCWSRWTIRAEQSH